MPKAVGTTQAAKRLRCSLGWVYVLIRTGELPATRLQNGHWVIPVAAIDERLKRRNPSTEIGASQDDFPMTESSK